MSRFTFTYVKSGRFASQYEMRNIESRARGKSGGEGSRREREGEIESGLCSPRRPTQFVRDTFISAGVRTVTPKLESNGTRYEVGSRVRFKADKNFSSQEVRQCLSRKSEEKSSFYFT